MVEVAIFINTRAGCRPRTGFRFTDLKDIASAEFIARRLGSGGKGKEKCKRGDQRKIFHHKSPFQDIRALSCDQTGCPSSAGKGLVQASSFGLKGPPIRSYFRRGRPRKS